MFEEIKSQIAEMLNVDEAIVTAESNLITDLKADSMDIATLLLEVEENYGIEIAEDDLDSLKTVGDIVAYIENKKN
ncbi:MAG: acyl carrier protein [Clostridia bacterium]|nr:acyl carrier protein [Clostridia bacterium]